jgi:hypothetical protein
MGGSETWQKRRFRLEDLVTRAINFGGHLQMTQCGKERGHRARHIEFNTARFKSAVEQTSGKASPGAMSISGASAAHPDRVTAGHAVLLANKGIIETCERFQAA